MRHARFIAITLAFAAAPAITQPQIPATEDEPDPLYRVEIIAFANLDTNRGEEDFNHGSTSLGRKPLPSRYQLPPLTLESVFISGAAGAEGSNSIEVPQPAGIEILRPGELPAIPYDQLELLEPYPDRRQLQTSFLSGTNARLPDGFRILTSDELELSETVAAMRRSRPYRVLGHVGWLQTGVDTDRSVQLDLKRIGITNPSGTIEVYRRRFLHVAVDLNYIDGDGTFWQATPGFGLAPLAYAESFHLVDEANAMRSGEYWYIDHPLFGILVRITPAPEPEPEEETDALAEQRPAA